VEALAECSFTRPTNIQHEALPAILATDDHSLIASETGNGKTLCFLIPMLQNIIRLKEANLNRYRSRIWVYKILMGCAEQCFSDPDPSDLYVCQLYRFFKFSAEIRLRILVFLDKKITQCQKHSTFQISTGTGLKVPVLF
jgi:DEAD/DEAH box helicase